jgi:hypothetical protein
VIGTVAIVAALLLGVFVSKILGLVVGVIAVLVLPWVPVPSVPGTDAGD